MRNRTTRYLRIGLIPASIGLAGIVLSRLRSLFQPTPPATPTFIAADHPHIRYVGRWDLRDARRPSVGWQGAMMTLQFEGTALSALMRPQYSSDFIRVVIDGVVQPAMAIEASDDPVVLAQNLSAGPHRIDIVKETYQGGDMTVAGFWLTGTLSAPPPAPPRHIAFFGDSNLAGESLSNEENNSGIEYMGCHYSYAGITARMCNASYHNVAYGGSTISSVQAIFAQTSMTNSTPWNFASQAADVVVIDLGSNDVDKGEARIRADYHTFLDAVRHAYPHAHIVLWNSYGWDSHEPANYSAAVVAERNDPQMSAGKFPWFFAQWHGCEYDHAGMATYLARHLHAQLGWQIDAADVMSGFGQNGAVANGNFAAIAPFGGFGWRYANHPGVARVTDSAGYDGNHFVRLQPGATIHQPNPAHNGVTITATLYARSATAGQLQLTIDFRDQTMYTAPLISHSETFSLNESWQAYTITFQAPTTTATPVFHTRLTIAAAQAAIEVDAVQMTTGAT